AAQALACTRAWGLADDAEHVNAHGGAIAIGHPLGASGARLALTAARALHMSGGDRALATMCVGVGQGSAGSGSTSLRVSLWSSRRGSWAIRTGFPSRLN
ncbi:MAG TPA: hypothetical protein PKV86_02455, partial [Syntrophobacteraceae bacterium]|nr:hypothetical protein [Syntrophobacteraceae bacterium]